MRGKALLQTVSEGRQKEIGGAENEMQGGTGNVLKVPERRCFLHYNVSFHSWGCCCCCCRCCGVLLGSFCHGGRRLRLLWLRLRHRCWCLGFLLRGCRGRRLRLLWL